MIAGGAGADTIIAGESGETLSGGGGADVFVFDELPGLAPHITDFTPGVDKLDFSGLFRPGGDLSGLPGPWDLYLSVESDGADGTIIVSNVNIGADLVYLDHVAPAQVKGSDWLVGWSGLKLDGTGLSDALAGAAGDDRLFGLAGDDTLQGGEGLDYLRGGDGRDLLSGGGAFDDLHGNSGDDTVAGGLGDDWVVGGQDNDQLHGDEGNDIVYGNLGGDTCDGGDGADTVRGGQGDDVLAGGAGDDWLSGDRGNDTLSGGAGADVFHAFGESGSDRITDFNPAEGDRVHLDPGIAYTVAQLGADSVISLSGGAQIVLVGVQAGSLSSGWIFAG